MHANYQTIPDYKYVKRKLISAGLTCLKVPSDDLGGQSLADVIGRNDLVELALDIWSDCVIGRMNPHGRGASNSARWDEILSNANELFWRSVEGQNRARFLDELGKVDVSSFKVVFERHLAEIRDILDAENLTVKLGRSVGKDRIRILRHIDNLRHKVLDACSIRDQEFFKTLGLAMPRSTPEDLTLATTILAVDRSESERDGLKKPRLASNRFNNIVNPERLLEYMNDLIVFSDPVPLCGDEPDVQRQDPLSLMTPEKEPDLETVIWEFSVNQFLDDIGPGGRIALRKLFFPHVAEPGEFPPTWVDVAEALDVKDTRTARKWAQQFADELRKRVVEWLDGLRVSVEEDISIEELKVFAWWMREVRKSPFCDVFGYQDIPLNRSEAARCLGCSTNEVDDRMKEIEKVLIHRIRGTS